MENAVDILLNQYGIYGIILILITAFIYLIFNDRKNGWGNKIDFIGDKIENINNKIEWVEEKLTEKIDTIERKVMTTQKELKNKELQEARVQSFNIMHDRHGGKLSKILRQYCQKINCDHVFMGLFHNGVTDLRGLHYCKFDIIIDEFSDPLKLHLNDTDFQPLYKDENIIAYGDLPYQMTHIDTAIFDLKSKKLLNLSDTLYRRCKSRDIKYIGFAGLRDKNGYVIGFIGCVSYTDEKPIEQNLLLCAHEIENIYINNE